MRVLITYAWCRTAYVAAESLAKSGATVYVCGPSSLSMARPSRYVSGFDKVPDPFVDPQDYADAILEIVRTRDIDVIVPVHEDALILRLYEYRLPSGILIACPTADKLATALDKYKILQVASGARVDFPTTLAPGGIDEAVEIFRKSSYPLVIKTRRGNSGKGVFVVHSSEDAERIYQDLIHKLGLEDNKLPIIQEFVKGQVYGGCFIALEGKMLAGFTERYLRCKEGGFGTSVFREPCQDDNLLESTARLAKALNWTGIGHFDFIRDEGSGAMKLIEMNPRMWGALNMAVKNGYDFPAALLTLTTESRFRSEAFRPVATPVRSMWIIGEMIAGMADFLHGKLTAPLASMWHILHPGCRCSYDDFRANDPLPFLLEGLYYAVQFALSGGKTNPENVEMLG